MIFDVEGGCFSYPSGDGVLNDVSFSVKEGDVMAVLGPNGAGKTTLLRCMMGLLPWRTGCSRLDGRDIRELSAGELWRKVAYVPQAKGMAFSYSAEEMVLLGRSAYVSTIGQPSKADLDSARMAMEIVGISYLRDKPCCRMSGGELQMVLIARALAAEPELLVLDEPESNLDYRNQLIVLDVIEKLARERGICSIFNTHYPAHALRIATKSLLMDGCGHASFGDSKSIINEEAMRSSFSVNVRIDRINVDSDVFDLVVPLHVV